MLSPQHAVLCFVSFAFFINMLLPQHAVLFCVEHVFCFIMRFVSICGLYFINTWFRCFKHIKQTPGFDIPNKLRKHACFDIFICHFMLYTCCHPMLSFHVVMSSFYGVGVLSSKTLSSKEYWSNGTLVERNIGRTEHSSAFSYLRADPTPSEMTPSKSDCEWCAMF